MGYVCDDTDHSGSGARKDLDFADVNVTEFRFVLNQHVSVPIGSSAKSVYVSHAVRTGVFLTLACSGYLRWHESHPYRLST